MSSKGNGKIPQLFSMFTIGYCFLVWAAIPPLENINLIRIRLAVHKLENETPQHLKSDLLHMKQLWKYGSSACESFCQTAKDRNTYFSCVAAGKQELTP